MAVLEFEGEKEEMADDEEVNETEAAMYVGK